jgi:hypothetical protein
MNTGIQIVIGFLTGLCGWLPALRAPLTVGRA